MTDHLRIQAVACCIAAMVIATHCQADDTTKFVSVLEKTFVAEHDGSQQKYVVMPPPGLAAKSPVSVLITLHGHGSDRWQFLRQN